MLSDSVDETSADENALKVTGLDKRREMSELVASQIKENDVIKTESNDSINEVGTVVDEDL